MERNKEEAFNQQQQEKILYNMQLNINQRNGNVSYIGYLDLKHNKTDSTDLESIPSIEEGDDSAFSSNDVVDNVVYRENEKFLSSSVIENQARTIMMRNKDKRCFPKDARALGTKEKNTSKSCWSEPKHDLFRVRGKDYFKRRNKVQSGAFVFPSRGVELFVTDNIESTKNVGRNSEMLGGCLRDDPTFIINFRLPIGVLVMYFEIPERFRPYLTADCKNLEKRLSEMTVTDRTICRFLTGDDAHRQSKLKIISRIEDGPWIVKAAVPSKPVIIGNKLPVSYYFQPEEDRGNKSPYLEVELDVSSSNAAKAMLNICMSCTKSLIIDIGFVIQGDQADELPEQMLVGTRLHRLDLSGAPSFPSQSCRAA